MRRVRYCFLLENLVFNLFVLCVSERSIFQFSNTFTCLLLFSLVGLGVESGSLQVPARDRPLHSPAASPTDIRLFSFNFTSSLFANSFLTLCF